MTTEKTPAPLDRAASVQIYELLSVAMPPEALKEDISRGFPLTSIRAGFVLERLNQVFGLLGYGWRYSYSDHRLENCGGKTEVLLTIALQWRVCDNDQPEGPLAACPPIYWGTFIQDGQVRESWHFPPGHAAVWSEPVFATGGSSTQRKGSLPAKDAFQGAVTNGITKAASRLGVGLEIFKGQYDDLDLLAHSPAKAKAKARQAKPAQAKPAQAKPAQAKAKDPEPGLDTLAAMQKAAEAHVARIKADNGDEQPKAKLVQTLAQLMEKKGLQMQTARLIHALLGEGPYSLRRVMGVYNFLLMPLTQQNIDTLNAASWEGFPEASNGNK